MKNVSVFLVLLMFSNSSFSRNVQLQELRMQTRVLLGERHCMACHTPGLKTTKEAALKVYNLASERWYSTMSERQLHKFEQMISSSLTVAELAEMGWKKPENPLSKIQKENVSAFVREEIEFRRSGGIEFLLDK